MASKLFNSNLVSCISKDMNFRLWDDEGVMPSSPMYMVRWPEQPLCRSWINIRGLGASTNTELTIYMWQRLGTFRLTNLRSQCTQTLHTSCEIGAYSRLQYWKHYGNAGYITHRLHKSLPLRTLEVDSFLDTSLISTRQHSGSWTDDLLYSATWKQWTLVNLYNLT